MPETTQSLLQELTEHHLLHPAELLQLLQDLSQHSQECETHKKTLYTQARLTAESVYGRRIFLRGLIEISNYCQNNCQYCGIQVGNQQCERYRLAIDDILAICDQSYHLGYRTFVLQGGEDPYYTDDRLSFLISSIKTKYPNCAVTLSIGERPTTSYQKLFKAGADRYLLRHETRSKELYTKLHPHMSYHERERCLWDLKNIGYQTGAGFMVGLPGQTLENYVDDLLFLKKLQPHMVGIGPFIPHHHTPLGAFPAGNFELTRILLSVTRLLLPEVLLPATTALGSIQYDGWEKGFEAGANVVMLNLSPPEVRKKYALYNGKTTIPDESSIHLDTTHNRIRAAGYIPEMNRGDHHQITRRDSQDDNHCV